MKDVLFYAEGENVLTGRPMLSNVKVLGRFWDSTGPKRLSSSRKNGARDTIKRRATGSLLPV